MRMKGELVKRLAASLLPPIVLAIVVAMLWQACVSYFAIPPYLLPGPFKVLQALWSNGLQLLEAAKFTASAALLGLAASICIGTSVAVLFSQSRVIRQSTYPYAIYLQTAPIVAVAPLLATWIGEGFLAIVVVTFIISLFPIITNATDGLLSVPADLRELFRLNNATRWQTLWHLQLPNALPRMVTGAKTSSAMVVLGATVGEYFVGSSGQDDFGLGHVIFKTIPLLQIDKLFATTIVCTTLSVIIFYSVSALGRMLTYWDRVDA